MQSLEGLIVLGEGMVDLMVGIAAARLSYVTIGQSVAGGKVTMEKRRAALRNHKGKGGGQWIAHGRTKKA